MSEAPTAATAVKAPQASVQADAHAHVRDAIARAANATGIDFRYLMAQARLESGLDPTAQASNSSAAGLFQFTNSTWLGTLDRHGAEHGLSWLADRIEGGQVVDGALRNQILSLRGNPEIASMMAAELASDNRVELTGVLGREPDASELYLAHFLGAQGAKDFLSALAIAPGQSAAALMPRAAAANRPIFYAKDGTARSVAGVMDLLRSRISGAMGLDGPAPNLPYDTSGFMLGSWASSAGWPSGGNPLPMVQATLAARSAGGQVSGLGPVAQEFQSARAEMAGNNGPDATAAAPRIASRSMADTLKSAFGSSEAALPGNVRSAYGKLARFGL